jgi:LmbE family N-acetylglucosaminyl deacetylase
MTRSNMITPARDLIPDHTSPLPPGPWLVFAPHADDETLGMGGALLLARRQGIEIDLIVLTDGAQGGAPGGPALAAQREQEALALAVQLGLRRVAFWRQPDGGLTVTPSLIERVTATVTEQRPAAVFFPSPLELHADHRAAAALVWQGCQRSAERPQRYAYEISVAGACNCLVDITAVAAEKRQLMDCYPSQLDQNNYVAMREALDTLRTYTLPAAVSRAEALFAYPDAAQTTLLAPLAAHLRQYWVNSRPAPLVSVIVRTKDRPHLLQEALQSVALQTHPNLELVVVNDGGADVTSLVQSYTAGIGHVRTVHLTENRGRAAAANAGLDAATGAYLLFLDDDDLIEPEHIAGLMTTLLNDPAALAAYAGAWVERPEGRSLWDLAYDRVRLQTFGLFPIHAVLFSRHVLDKGCRFDETLPIYEDWDFWLQVVEETDFVHAPQVSAVYRALGSSANSVFHFDDQRSQEVRQAIMAKWAQRWPGPELAAQVELARSFYLASSLTLQAQQQAWQQQRTALEDQRQAAEAALHRLRTSRTYRLGCRLTAPWHWLTARVRRRRAA